MHKRTPNGVEFTRGKYTAAEVDDIRAPSVYIWGGTSTAAPHWWWYNAAQSWARAYMLSPRIHSVL